MSHPLFNALRSRPPLVLLALSFSASACVFPGDFDVDERQGTAPADILPDGDVDADGDVGADADLTTSDTTSAPDLNSDAASRDGDGTADLGLPDVCESAEVCDDGVDNDCDGTADAGDDECWPTDYLARTHVAVDPPGNFELTNFPVAVRIESLVADDWSVVDATGANIRVISSSGVELDHELERFEHGSRGVIWTKLPVLDRDTFFYVYFDSLGSMSTAVQWDVWTQNFTAVWHLDEQLSNGASGGQLLDSTEGRIAIQNGNEENASEGSVGNCQLVQLDEYIEVTATPDLIPTTGFTVSAWVNGDDAAEEGGQVFSAGPEGSAFSVGIGANKTLWQALFSDSAGAESALDGPNYSGTWTHVALVYDGGQQTVSFYVDGATRDPINVAGSQAVTEFLMGGPKEMTAKSWHGKIDELRIASVPRSQNWLRAEYTNYSGGVADPAVSLLTYGSLELAP